MTLICKLDVVQSEGRSSKFLESFLKKIEGFLSKTGVLAKLEELGISPQLMCNHFYSARHQFS